MGYEIKYTFHPRKESGGYDTDAKEEKTVKVGKRIFQLKGMSDEN